MAVVWNDQSTAEQRTGAVETILKQSKLTLNELSGSAKQQAITEFQSGSGWYRGIEVDRLSEEEAGIIAARLVRRVQAKTNLPSQKAEGLQKAISDALKKRFTDDKVKQEQNALLKSGNGLQLIASEYLDEEQIPILKEALASGLRPLPNER